MKPAQEQLVAEIVAQLERGTAPWIRPWSTIGTSDMPQNFCTRRSYHGVNILQLWLAQSASGYPTAEWCTFNQAKALGASVRRGEHATPVWFLKPRVTTDRDADGDEGAALRGVIFKQFAVFNRCQLDGLPHLQETSAPEPFDVLTHVEHYVRRVAADVRPGGDAAFYSITHDYIACPHPTRFVDTTAYYATLLHEHVHWTGHTTRINRTFGRRFGDKAYAFEELVAELGAAFLTAQLAIVGTLRHAEYVATWAQVLSTDPKALWTAAASASEAVAFLNTIADASAAAHETIAEAA